ncbi:MULTISPECIES: dTDP-4-dehydrorhamnose 3,5-epimerase family protein [unclassified Leifsonia]|uniref:dTDP-4-dehydrorhamnose 3,5-epimerase family protein n=1 Tax=unclassified Leifsonia TaxID=2663824 RepID=UPI00087CE54C|nr:MULTISPECIES: dTDP-4-dehydrorhamnose 3,5-epimerase family protein [unclassified Leifsonia]MDR6612389.1 dTDP-4-dehydrorhamnose 3,5-epimerase [Leifsonia sp. 1010]SDH18546.1 dTDP-4-dehydrorhamnose 3,5-epimerase [Leifsonia sp. 197AMF]SDJ19988.1 dTDP-4-dehydrorhamnose 3,5-epimerase [Leifsonia sp. 466MF]SDJ45883.1 dTDP-4-dehydrorhamnose 3,5-epimerase [Leifsonia sp. 157MF]SDN41375.1 dTDP-4-dehydrorhamnose 3,5-epimerase [Leifsonia sp. 509MF]
MQIRELSIPDAYEVTPQQHADDRGVFFEWYRFDRLEEAVGHPLNLRQANSSVSKRGSVRGIHFADIPPSQAKYVTAPKGAVLDFVIDIRVGSPTFGKWDSVLLDDVDRRAIYVAEGLGHCFVALTEGATVSYLVTDTYNPTREHGINPLDADIALRFPDEAGEPLLSPKDTDAPGLHEAAEAGLLPTWEAARAFYASLDQAANQGGK